MVVVVVVMVKLFPPSIPPPCPCVSPVCVSMCVCGCVFVLMGVVTWFQFTYTSVVHHLVASTSCSRVLLPPGRPVFSSAAAQVSPVLFVFVRFVLTLRLPVLQPHCFSRSCHLPRPALSPPYVQCGLLLTAWSCSAPLAHLRPPTALTVQP